MSKIATDGWADYEARLRGSVARAPAPQAAPANTASDAGEAQDAAPFCLAIIGTAGRRTDARRLSRESFERMVSSARLIVRQKGYTHLVSGGAAWADHVAVALALEGDLIPAANLTLHLPAALVAGQYDESAGPDGAKCNRYHRQFSQKLGCSSLDQIARVCLMGAQASVNPRGFKARNSDVARACHGMLAFTFGSGTPWKAQVYGSVAAARAQLNPEGTGTVDTWNKARVPEKIHVPLAEIDGASVPRYGL